jgi:oxygen-independent coproporphyrinogen-3 oxidase
MQTIPVQTPDGVQLALCKVSDSDGPAVILTHGTFSNHRSCLALAQKLAEDGFAPWVFDWRGHGKSQAPTTPATLDEVAHYDIPAVLHVVRQFHRQDKVFLLGHSGGGLAMSMWMARNPELANKQVHGLVLMAAQATGAAQTLKHRVLISLIDIFLKVTRSAPGHLLKIGPEPESSALMRQWCRWNLTQKFSGLDDFDYLQHLQQVTVPVLALAGAGDLFIAPVNGCLKLAEAFGGQKVQFQQCGRASGYSEDYTHDRLILSKTASAQIWPVVSAWLSSNLDRLPALVESRDAH